MAQLFVYGTLRNATNLGVRIGSDRIQGTLYDLGPFPGYRRGGDGWVTGEVLEVTTEELRLLDYYEGVGQGFYQRVRVTTEKDLEVWVYEFSRVGEHIVASGDWLNPSLEPKDSDESNAL